MDKHYIETHDVVARYVKNELSDEELEAFEEYYFEHPGMLESIETERLMRAALRAHDHASTEPARRPPQLLYAIAASLLVGFMIATLLPVNFSQPGTAIEPVQTAWVIADRQGASTRVELANIDQPLALTIEVRSGLEEPLQAKLIDANDEEIWRTTNVSLDNAGDISILLPAAALQQQVYVLELLRDGNVVDQYEFEIVTATK